VTGDRWENSLRERPRERALWALESHRGAMLESHASACWSRGLRPLGSQSEIAGA